MMVIKKLKTYEFRDSKLGRVVFTCEANDGDEANKMFEEETGARYFKVKEVIRYEKKFVG
jgi:hypothetical protein